MAIGVYEACKELRINIPDDLSIVGFDDNYISMASEPELTTVNTPLSDMGAHDAEFLITSEIELDAVLDCSFIMRKSASVMWEK